MNCISAIRSTSVILYAKKGEQKKKGIALSEGNEHECSRMNTSYDIVKKKKKKKEVLMVTQYHAQLIFVNWYHFRPKRPS